MKNFVVNMGIAGIACLIYYLDILELFTSKYAGWIIGGVIFLLFLAALKILGNPFAKDDDDD
jgi:integral membrane sensor domain MASE1